MAHFRKFYLTISQEINAGAVVCPLKPFVHIHCAGEGIPLYPSPVRI
jgi:hypothetical protein